VPEPTTGHGEALPEHAPETSSAHEVPLLEARSISVNFGGILALSEVSLVVGMAESVGRVGPNGASKTTFFNCIWGQIDTYKGQVLYAGRPIDDMPAYKRARLGIARTFQRIEVFDEMTVREHMIVAERARSGEGALWKDLLNMGGPSRAELEGAERVLELVGLTEHADTPVAALSLGYCRLVELGRALALEPRLLLADEPSSGLDTHESAMLASLFRRVRAERGTAILIVEHNLDMVAEVVDRVVVLDFGHEIAAGPLEEVIADPVVRRAYLGKIA